MHWSAEHNGYVDENGVPQARHDRSGTRALLVRAAVFVALFAALYACWEQARGTAIERWVIHDMTVRPAASLVNWLTPDVRASAVNYSVRAPGGGLNVLNGCEGLDALFLLFSAFIVAPMSWKTRLIGLSWGVPVVFAINQVRILTLFYAYRESPMLFDALHSTVAPILIVLLVGAYFYAWLSVSARAAAFTA